MARQIVLPAPLCPGAPLWRGLAVLWLGFAAWGMLSPGVAVPPGLPGFSDLVLHGLVLGMLAGLLGLGWPVLCGRLWPLLLLAPLGLEFGQIPVPGRVFDAGDLLANLAGTAVGGMLAGAVLNRVRESC